ncbi:MAG: multidrug efflux pump subunit AcrB [Porticoccaceae bacterium]|jgi:multidrug efflux pump subunit AcrB
MKTLTRLFIEHPVAANLLMVLILAAGALSITHIRVESFPQMAATQLVILVTYPGGTAQQVDEGITQRVEEAVSSIPGILRVNSQSRSGQAIIRVRKRSGTSLDRLIEDVRTNVNSIVGFPADAEKPVIYRDEFTNLASFVQVYGNVDEAVLQQVAIRVEKTLKRHSDISQVTNLGRRHPELVIEPWPEQLRRYQLSLDVLIDRVQQWSLEYRSGSLNTAQGRLTLKADGYADNLQRLRNLPVISTQEGTITLADIANIRRDYEEDDSIVRYQGKPAVVLMVSTSSKDHLLRVDKGVSQVLEKLELGLPQGVQLDVMANMTPYVKEQLSILGSNAVQGLLIVLVLLGLFLNVRLALWVALGIPISLAGALWLMGLDVFDYSINDITLFGMILVLGILVDDAVVVGESIHECRQTMSDPKAAAYEGVQRVAVPTVFGVLTTIAAFSPLLWIDNDFARMLAGFSAVVIFALIFSLLESKFILPCHLSGSLGSNLSPGRGMGRVLTSVQANCNEMLERFAQRIYLPLLRLSLLNRYTVLVLFVCIMVLAYGLVIKGSVRSTFFPEIPGRYLTAKVAMDVDAPLSLTLLNSTKLDSAVDEVNEVLQSRYQLDQTPIQKLITSIEGPSSVESTAALSAEALANIPAQEIIDVWRKSTGLLEGSYSVQFGTAGATAGLTGLSVSHPDREVAQAIAQELKLALDNLGKEEYGVQDVRDDAQGGRRQLSFKVTANGRQMGVTQRQLALLIGGGYGGIELNRLLDQGEENRVLLRFSESQRRTLDELLAMPVQLSGGGNVALGDVSEQTFEWVPEQVSRRNRDRVISVSWRQDRSIASPEAVLAELRRTVFSEMLERFPQANIAAIGEFEEITEVQVGFKKALLLTLLLIYVLLALPLKSYIQPLIIMSVIPFGFAGAIFGHGIMQMPVSVLSLFGMMAMTGVVVNDSLVLLSSVNQLHSQGMPLEQALLEAGRSRLRAIFLTTVTTVCGLLPLLSESSEQAQYLKPAAVSPVFGELFATPITLILIPLLVRITADFRKERKPAEDEICSPT